MPRNKKEGILFSFVMSAIMIFVMAALNYYVRVALGMGEFAGNWIAGAWTHAATSFPVAYAVGMVCDLGFCTPSSRRIASMICKEGDRPAVRFFAVKFSMVVVMTVCMTVFGAVAAAGLGWDAVTASCLMFPFNFTLALPIQMLVVAPISGHVVNAVGDVLRWNAPAEEMYPATS